MKKRRLQGFWAELFESIIIGCVIGAVVGTYQFAMQYAVKGSQFMYSSKNPWIIIGMIVAVVGIAVMSHFILKKNPGVRGSGVPYMEHSIQQDHYINWTRELPLMLLNSIASGFAGMPLGSEGPSVVLGGKTAEMVEDAVNAGEDDTVVMGFGTGFGCAVLSPLAGLCYIFEEALKKFNIKFFLRGIAMMVSAYLVTSLINHHSVFHVHHMEVLPFEHFYVFVFLVIVNVVLGCAFSKGLTAAKNLFEKHKDKFWSKNFGFVIFAVVLVLNFVCLSWMGSGAHIIEEITHFDNIWILIALLAFRFVITIFAGTDRVTGGVVIPMLTLGAIGGQIVCLVCNKLLGLPEEYNQVVVIMSMAIIFTVVNKTPITSSVLFLSAVIYAVQHSAESVSVGQFFTTFVDYLPMILMNTVAVVVATIVSKWFVKDGLYHMLLHVDMHHGNVTHHQDHNDVPVEPYLTEEPA